LICEAEVASHTHYPFLFRFVLALVS
jgi:hypothetical protein